MLLTFGTPISCADRSNKNERSERSPDTAVASVAITISPRSTQRTRRGQAGIFNAPLSPRSICRAALAANDTLEFDADRSISPERKGVFLLRIQLDAPAPCGQRHDAQIASRNRKFGALRSIDGCGTDDPGAGNVEGYLQVVSREALTRESHARKDRRSEKQYRCDCDRLRLAKLLAHSASYRFVV